MKNTVLITGSSTGFGAAAANYFAAKGWNVIATMRDTSKEKQLNKQENIFVTHLDVEDAASIDVAITAGLARFGKIDVVINNAGYGLFGIFESFTREAIQQQFAVNLFGAMDVAKAILPHFRAQQSGVLINVSSGAGVVGFPNASIYNASKFALEGWSEGLRYELAAIGIKVRIVEPGGATQTDFLQRVLGEGKNASIIPDYVSFLQKSEEMYANLGANSDDDAVEKVVAALYAAATADDDQLRYAPTSDIQPLLNARRSSSEEEFNSFTNGLFLGK